MDSFKATDVFTPSKPAELTFVEREALTEQLVNAVWTPGKQVVVFGHSGSGKTTLLLNKLEQTREYWIRCSSTNDTTLESLILDAFDKVGPFYRKEVTKSRSSSVSTNLAADYLRIKSSIGTNTEERSGDRYERVLPPQLTVQRLVDFLGQAGALWIVDDFHKLPDAEKTRFAQTLKVFVDASAEYDEVKVVAIGAVDTAREVIECDPEMRNRVAEVHVPLMSSDELEQIMSIGEGRLNCRFSRQYKTSITDFSSGLAAVCHQLCLNVCFAANLLQTSQRSTIEFTNGNVKDGIERYIADASDTLKSTYDRATYRKKASKWDNCKMIVRTIAELPQEGALYSTILDAIQKKHPDYPQGNLTTYLGQLQAAERGEILRFDATSGIYSFANPFYRAYAQIVEGTMKPHERMAEIPGVDDFEASVRHLMVEFNTRMQERIDYRRAIAATVKGTLKLTYREKVNRVRHPDGSVSIRLTLRNEGPGRAKRVRVKIDSLVPRTQQVESQPYSAQFTGAFLQVEGSPPGFSLHEQDVVEVKVVRSEKDSRWFFVASHNRQTQEIEEFRVPAGEYVMTVTASCLDGQSDTRSFVVCRGKTGELEFTPN